MKTLTIMEIVIECHETLCGLPVFALSEEKIRVPSRAWHLAVELANRKPEEMRRLIKALQKQGIHSTKKAVTAILTQMAAVSAVAERED